MLTINLQWDAKALAAPQSFRDAVQAAASVLDAAIFDTITVNVGVGYGEYDNGSMQLTSGVSLGGVDSGVHVSYPLLKAALTSNESSPSDISAYTALPATTALNGQSSFNISRAQAKALGALPANDPAVDGEIGFPTSFSPTGVTATAFAELLHAMGLLNGTYPLTLFEYTSPGVHLLNDGAAGTTAYFSVDGGVTSLATYDIGFDPTLFLTPTKDQLSVPAPSTATLSALDLEEIGAIGFNVTSSRPIPLPTIAPSITPVGTAATLTVQNVSIPVNAVIPVSSFIKGVTVPSGDAISVYGFDDVGGGNGTGAGAGHLAINGIVEPNNAYVNALDTQLGVLDYVGANVPGTDTILIQALDQTTGTVTLSRSVTVTTVAGSSPGTTTVGGVTTATNASGVVTVSTTTAANTVLLGAAQSVVASTGTDTITASTGPATVTTSGNARVIGGAGALTVQGGPGNDVVLAGTGGLTFTGGGGFDTVVGGGNPASITAGTGGGLFQGGGNATITAGAGGGQNVEFGTNGDQMYGVGPAGVLFGDNGGDPGRATLMSSAADTGNSVFFGASGSGQMTFITGAGNDLLAVGQGTNTVRLGSGTDVVFANSPAAGTTTIYAGVGNASIVMGGAATTLVVAAGVARNLAIYNDATSADKVTLSGYAPTQVATALAAQNNTGGGSILTLSDNTTLAFVGVGHATAALFG